MRRTPVHSDNHHAHAPTNTPITRANASGIESLAGETSIAANAAAKARRVIGLETVNKNADVRP